MIKNIEKSKVFTLDNEITNLENQIVSKILVQNKFHSSTLFAIAKNQEIATHTTTGDALVFVLDGKGKFIIDDKEFIVEKGESIIMPKNIPHAVYGIEDFKMLLCVYYDEK